MYGTFLDSNGKPMPNRRLDKLLKELCNTQTASSSQVESLTNVCESTSNTSIVEARAEALEDNSDTHLHVLRMRKPVSNSSSKNSDEPYTNEKSPQSIIGSLIAFLQKPNQKPTNVSETKKGK